MVTSCCIYVYTVLSMYMYGNPDDMIYVTPAVPLVDDNPLITLITL